MGWVFSAFADEAGGTTDIQIAALKRAGINHIDPRNIEGHNISVLPLDLAKDIAEKFKAANIAVNMFGSPIGKIDIADDFNIDLGKLEHLGKLKPIFGCDKVRLFSYYNKSKAPDADWQKISLDRLTKLRDLAAMLGMSLYHENEHGIFGQSSANVLTIAKTLRDPSPNGAFKIIFDFDNYNHAAEQVQDSWKVVGAMTDAFHLKDSDANKQHVPAGQGVGRIKEILTEAVKLKWTGPVSLEPHLAHSGAVATTNVSGKENQQYKNLPQPEIFHIAALAGKKIMAEAGATVI